MIFGIIPRVIFRICYTQFPEPLGEWNLWQFWNITSGIYAKYRVQIILLFVYTNTCKRFVIFTCRYFKLSWNTSALSQSDCRNFSCSSIKLVNCACDVYYTCESGKRKRNCQHKVKNTSSIVSRRPRFSEVESKMDSFNSALDSLCLRWTCERLAKS